MEVLSDKLQIKNLTKKFVNKTILDNLCFDIRNGEILSIIGPSGCGKTTLLMTLIGLYKPESGNIFMHGKDITKVEVSKRKMGLIFQDYSLFENMSVVNNVSYALKFSKDRVERENRYDLAVDILSSLGLKNHLHKYPSQLSGGERQRAAIARTLVLSPEIILFDEPMSALDAESKIAFKNLLFEIRKKFKSTMIYVTHDQEDAFSMADRVMVMNNGKINQIDTPGNIMKKPADAFVKKFVVENLLKKSQILNKLIQTEEEIKR